MFRQLLDVDPAREFKDFLEDEWVCANDIDIVCYT